MRTWKIELGWSIATAVVFAVACGEEFVEPAVSVEAAGGRWSTGGRAPVTGGAPTTDPETGGASGSGIAAGGGSGGDVDAYCGNGRVEDGEECDDGNMSNRDSCLLDCLKARCGDGYVQPGEECEPGNPGQPPCEDDCTFSPECGNGMVEEEAGEECDDGNAVNNDDCTNRCQRAVCGDDIIHNLGTGDEICDDGEDNGYEFPARCSPTCTIDDHCFNGWWEPEKGEECDSQDKGDESSCNRACDFNRCGDGYAYLRVLEGTTNPNPLHECDDFNEDDSDACTSACAWNACGDGVVFIRGYDELYDSNEDGNELDDNPNPVEECDDGNDDPGDGCYECQLED